MGGVDKASIELGGVTLLERALARCPRGAEVVVVGDEVPTTRPVTFTREDPPGGGPAAGLLAGLRRASRRAATWSRCSPSTCRGSPRRRSRGCLPRSADDGRRGAGRPGRPARSTCARSTGPPRCSPPRRRPRTEHGLPMRGLLAPCGWRRCPPSAARPRTWTPGRTCARSGRATIRADPNVMPVLLRPGLGSSSWRREPARLDRRALRRARHRGRGRRGADPRPGRDAAHNVERPAAPITTFLLGYAAAAAEGDPAEVGAAGRPGARRWPRAGTSRRTPPDAWTTWTSRSRSSDRGPGVSRRRP